MFFLLQRYKIIIKVIITKVIIYAELTFNKYAVVMGNEVKGVHQEVVDASDGCLEIPQLGTKHSMNVSVTAGIIIYKFAESLILT